MRASRPAKAFALLGVLLVFGSCGSSSTPTQPSPPPPACAFTLSTSSQSFGAAGGSGRVEVATTAGCSWTARAEAGWLSVTAGASLTGPGSVAYTALLNDATSGRSGTLTIAGLTVTVTQDGASPSPQCAFALDDTSESFGAEGGTDRFTVVTTEGCRWSVRTPATWIHVITPASGEAVGSSRVTFSVDSHAGDARRDDIVAAGLLFRVNQAGTDAATCTYRVTPTTMTQHWHGITGNSGRIDVTTQGTCEWSSSVDVSWMSLLEGRTGRGSGIVSLSIEQYTNDGSRRGRVEIRWPTETAGQNVSVTQEGCRYGLDQTAQAFPAAGGRGSFTVVSQAVSPDCAIPCPWTATAGASWITILTRMPSSGDNLVTFEVAPNPTSVSRHSTITVGERSLVIDQSGL